MDTVFARNVTIGEVVAPQHKLHWRHGMSIFTAMPRYRILRAIRRACVHPLHHAKLSMKLHLQWHRVRCQSSWSRR